MLYIVHQKQHSCVHGGGLHLSLHGFLHAHFISSLQSFDASGRVLHKGTQIRLLLSFHPTSKDWEVLDCPPKPDLRRILFGKQDALYAVEVLRVIVECSPASRYSGRRDTS
jgi:hypothetical protein